MVGVVRLPGSSLDGVNMIITQTVTNYPTSKLCSVKAQDHMLRKEEIVSLSSIGVLISNLISVVGYIRTGLRCAKHTIASKQQMALNDYRNIGTTSKN